jgi:hypothetical protein
MKEPLKADRNGENRAEHQWVNQGTALDHEVK